MNILLGWTGFAVNARVMGGCAFSCGIHMGTNMRFRYYTPQLIWCFGVFTCLRSRSQFWNFTSEVSMVTNVENVRPRGGRSELGCCLVSVQIICATRLDQLANLTLLHAARHNLAPLDNSIAHTARCANSTNENRPQWRPTCTKKCCHTPTAQAKYHANVVASTTVWTSQCRKILP